ncbi:DciA family protein [Streptomyces sp. NPDC007901]|uniref:DciA family protein n=1 Tax=Streptomyces sp. NPDC007901 TaxID=3364785 RepID=UPI0036E05C74
MTETINLAEQTSGTAPAVSGVDLARVALHQAREAAKKRGDSEARTPRRRQQTAVRRDGREPSGFAAVLQGLMADRAWEVPAAGGTVLDRWPDIAAGISPQLPSHVSAVAYNPATRQLDLLPDSPAYATQLRLITARIIAMANHTADTDAVHTIRVLPAGAAPERRTTQPAPAAAAALDVPVEPRRPAPEGYHQAVAAHRSAAPPSRIDPGIAEAVARQTRAMRALSRRAFPEPPDDAPAAIETARAERRRQAAATEAAALRRARKERAARKAGTAAAVREAGALRTTA